MAFPIVFTAAFKQPQVRHVHKHSHFYITCFGSLSLQFTVPGKPLVPFLRDLCHFLGWRKGRDPQESTHWVQAVGRARSWVPLVSVLEEGLGSLIPQDPGDCSNSSALCPRKGFVLWSTGIYGRKKAFHKMVFTVFGKIHPFARWIRSNIFSRSVHMFWDTLAKPSPEMSVC